MKLWQFGEVQSSGEINQWQVTWASRGGCAQEGDNWQPEVTEGKIDIVQDKVNRHLLEC